MATSRLATRQRRGSEPNLAASPAQPTAGDAVRILARHQQPKGERIPSDPASSNVHCSPILLSALLTGVMLGLLLWAVPTPADQLVSLPAGMPAV